jgi:hypothetical protein
MKTAGIYYFFKRMKILSIMSVVFLTVNCMGNSKSESIKVANARDTISKPKGMSARAKLLNLGSEEEPVFSWVEYVGPLKKNGIVYDHIIGFKYHFTSGIEEINYYENLNGRNSNETFNSKDYGLVEFPYSGNIKVVNKGDSLFFFQVLTDHKSDEVYNDLRITRMRTVEKVKDGSILSSEELQCNLKHETGDQYLLTMRDGTKIPYRLNLRCKSIPSEVSFLSRGDGRIYFIERSCFLELTNKKDLSKLKTD